MPSVLSFNDTAGESIPPDTAHAVSASLPTWESNVAYEEGESWILDKMQCGYPRFFVHKSIDRLASDIVKKYGHPNEKAMLFPSSATAQRCVDFMQKMSADEVRILRFAPNPHKADHNVRKLQPRLCAVLYPEQHAPIAKQVWQHAGEGVSSRRGEFCRMALLDGTMVEESTGDGLPRVRKGPKRYQRQVSVDEGHTKDHHTEPKEFTEGRDSSAFVEERFGRNLDVTLAAKAKLAIRRRIAGYLTNDMDLHEVPTVSEEVEQLRDVDGFSVDDVYLFPTGMNSIFQAHRTMLLAREPRKSISYG